MYYTAVKFQIEKGQEQTTFIKKKTNQVLNNEET